MEVVMVVDIKTKRRDVIAGVARINAFVIVVYL